MERTSHETLMKIYNLPQIGPTLEFLTMLALVTGRLLKVDPLWCVPMSEELIHRLQGGTPDVLAAARTVLSDWNHHKIPFFSVPPTIHPSSLPSMTAQGQIAPGAEEVGQARILTEMAPAFSLPGFGADDGMEAMEAADQDAFGAPAEEEMNVEDAGEAGAMETDDAEYVLLSNAIISIYKLTVLVATPCYPLLLSCRRNELARRHRRPRPRHTAL